MALPKFKPVANASPGTKRILKPLLGGLLAILAAAAGLELSNNDWDVGKIVKGSSPSDAKILRDQNGNIRRDSKGQIITRVMRDKNGNIVPEGTPGAKHTDEYNCADFATQPEAQQFFDNAGGVGHDTNVESNSSNTQEVRVGHLLRILRSLMTAQRFSKSIAMSEMAIDGRFPSPDQRHLIRREESPASSTMITRTWRLPQS